MTQIRVSIEDRTLDESRDMQWAILTEYCIGSATIRPLWRNATHIVDVRWLNGDFDRMTDKYEGL